ncbi:MAG: hypothetical protein B7Z80_12185 [Rhodospirillales bacterium 20-64-7]|nr:MAG: hypothetical protein B7Z80_12185 [Rhodospirillales bacterium 20-64-7]
MRKLISWLGCALLAGCTVGPNFKPPHALKAHQWNTLKHSGEAGVSELSNPDPRWWRRFHDPVLARLIADAIAGSPNLQQAELRVVSAQQQTAEAAAAGLPTLNGTGSFKRESLGLKGILESQGAYAKLNQLANGSSAGNLLPGAGTLNSLGAPTNLYQYGLSSSWELDLFGKVRRSVEAAKASAQAQAEAANDALIMLESEVAQAYFALRAAQQAAQIQAQAVQTAQTQFELTQSLYRRGLTSDIDAQQQRTELLNEATRAQTYQKQIGQALDRINVLAGDPPGTLDAMLSPPAPVPQIAGVIGIGIPSTLARRRPDIREAEAELHAATANVGVAVADFYPDISLTGQAGFRALDASYLTNWASLFYSAGPSVSLPIFQGGKLEANLKLAKTRQVSAALNYRGTVLKALREVEDALVAYRADRAAETDAAQTVQAAKLADHLAQSRYQHGLSSYLQALTSERSLLSAQQQLAQAKMTVADDVVALYTALGGGWVTAQAGS